LGSLLPLKGTDYRPGPASSWSTMAARPLLAAAADELPLQLSQAHLAAIHH